MFQKNSNLVPKNSDPFPKNSDLAAKNSDLESFLRFRFPQHVLFGCPDASAQWTVRRRARAFVTPKGVPHLALCSARATREGPRSKLREPLPRRKIGVTSKTPVGVISVVTLIRTDTTLDHSQKAEKV